MDWWDLILDQQSYSEMLYQAQIRSNTEIHEEYHFSVGIFLPDSHLTS